jgi:hypothetical protein
LSAKKVNSQLIFQLEQVIASRLLSSSLHGWENSWFTKPDGTAERYNLSLLALRSELHGAVTRPAC